jgi:hypothetical protein
MQTLNQYALKTEHFQNFRKNVVLEHSVQSVRVMIDESSGAIKLYR